MRQERKRQAPSVTVRLPNQLRRSQSLPRALNVSGETLGEVLEQACWLHPELGALLLRSDGAPQSYVMIAHEGVLTSARAAIDSPVAEGSVFELVLPISG